MESGRRTTFVLPDADRGGNSLPFDFLDVRIHGLGLPSLTASEPMMPE